jgi:hypothetical protein
MPLKWNRYHTWHGDCTPGYAIQPNELIRKEVRDVQALPWHIAQVSQRHPNAG